MPLPKILRDVLDLPTAPFLEHAVLAYVEQAAQRLAGVTVKHDRCGNLLAHYRNTPGRAVPIAFVAHTDHPGFEAQEMRGPTTLRAAFRGGVRSEHFRGAKVRFRVGERWIRGAIRGISKTAPSGAPGRPPMPEEVLVDVSRSVPSGTLGMWDLPGPTLRGDRLSSRVCDDLAGVAALLALLERLSRRNVRAECYCLFTRAEEVGFVGATGAIRARTLPRRVPVISIETSSALVHARVGDGPIIRVGDRGTVYDPELVGFCVRVAGELGRRRRGFRFQRKLMDGGMCEAAAFGVHGYTTCGICLALGNYHNMDTRRTAIAREWVSLRDWEGMVDLFEALVRDEQGPSALDDALRRRIDGLFEEQRELLRRGPA